MNEQTECDADQDPGTFARVWLVRLKNAQNGDENQVFALKILRKTDGMHVLATDLCAWLTRSPQSSS